MSLLDGRHFIGIVLERGKTEGDADMITFNAGRFRSSACDRYDYGDGAYTATEAGDSVSFEARTESPKYGSLVWRGVVRGARLAVFPEALVPGYPAWMWRLRPGPDMALTERIHARLRANSVSLAADELAPLREAARRHELAVVCGLHERDEALGGGTLYNSVVTIGADGALLNRHRKLMPTNPERMVWGCGDASGLKTVATPCGRVG